MKGFLFLLVACLAHYAAGESRVRRVVNGAPAPAPGQQCSVPYIVLIRKYCDGSNSAVTYRCSGTIIDNNWVLTSKYCVEPRGTCNTINRLEIIAGAHVYNNNNENTRQTATVQQAQLATNVLPHQTADLALVYLEGFQFSWQTNYVGEADFGEHVPAMGDYYQAAGWGRTSWTNPSQYATNLQYILLNPQVITEAHITLARVGYNDAGVHAGDTGGPVVYYETAHNCQNPEIVAVIGCGSAGILCSDTAPSNHVNVYTHRQWIIDTKEARDSGASVVQGCGLILTLTTLVVSQLL